MHAHTPPFTKPASAYDARKLYDETTRRATEHDAAHPISDIEAKVRTALSYLHHAQVLLKEAFLPPGHATLSTPAESAYLASFSPNRSRIASAEEVSRLRDLLTAEKLKSFGVGDVESRTNPHIGSRLDDFLNGADDPAHPLHHTTLAERLPEDRL